MTSPSDPRDNQNDDLPTRHSASEENQPTAVERGELPPVVTGVYVPGAKAAETAPRPLASRQGWPHVEGYEILEVLGQGGMGVVYKARQRGLKRLVALKMILSGAHAGAADLARFRTEAEAAARLQHPHIVQVHDIGEWRPESGGQALPYLALEYVEGESLASYMKGTPQPPRFAAEIVRTAAEAMQYAHDHQVIHRDLKPSNILLQKCDSGSLASGTHSHSTLLAGKSMPHGSALRHEFQLIAKIADFGLAKQLDDLSSQTVSGAIVGTPSYMAPEQAVGHRAPVGPPVDIYALGALLYEMLTSRPPFRGTNVYETLDQVRNAEPVPPRRLQPKVPGDLETICLKCLQKDPGKRYATALDLAEDLRRFLAHEPILARPVGWLERGWRWCRRNPGAALLISGIAFSLLAGSIVSTYFGIRAVQGEEVAKQNERIALERKAESDQRRYVAAYREASFKWKEGYIGEVALILKDLEPVRIDDPDLRGFEWHYLQRLCRLDLRTLEGHTHTVFEVICSPNGRWLATASMDKTARIWERATGRLVHTLTSPEDVYCAAFSPDSKTLAWGGKNKVVHLTDVATGAEQFTLAGHGESVRALAYRPDGAELASGSSDRTVRLWDLTTRQARVLPEHPGTFTSLAFNRDGKTLYSAGREAGIVVWDVKTGARQGVLAAYEGRTTNVTGSGDGRRLASFGEDQLIRIWDTATSKQIAFLHPSMENVRSIALSPDGTRVAAAGGDRIVRVWNVDTGQQVLTLRGHTAMIFGVSFSADGWQVLSASADKTVKIWDAVAPQEQMRLRLSAMGALSVAFIDGGRQVASCEPGGTIRLWDVETGMHLKSLSGHRDGTAGLSWIPKLQRLASVGRDGLVRLWDVESGAEVGQLSGANQSLMCCACSPDARWLAGYALDGTVFVWDLATRGIVHRFPSKAKFIRGLAFHPNGRWLAVASDEQHLQVWDVENGVAVNLVEEDKDTACCVAFSADGSQMVTGGDVGLWDLDTGKKRKALRQDIYPRLGITFSPDGRRVAAVAPDALVRMWDTATGQELVALPGHTARARCIAMSSDGLCLASGADDGFVLLWNARPLTYERLEVREAASLVRFLIAHAGDRDDILRRVGVQAGITEAVRQRAREITNAARLEPVAPAAR